MSFFGLGGAAGRESWRDHVYGQRPAIWIFVITLITILIYLVSRMTVETPIVLPNPRELAWAQCTQYISMIYGYSPVEAEIYHQTSISALPDNGYLVNINYSHEVDFRCTMQQLSDEHWRLVNLQMH